MVERFNLKLSDLLKGGENEASLLIRFMMACNDIMLANRCMGYFKGKDVADDQHLKKGACRYFLKIQCSHLVEALDLIYELNKMKAKSKKISETYAACSDESKENFIELVGHIRGKKQWSEKFQKIVSNIRNKIGFHYEDKMFKKAIKTRVNNLVGNDVELNYSDDIRLRRYNIADAVHDTLVCCQVWEIPVDIAGDKLQKQADDNACFANDLSKRFVNFSAEFIDIYLENNVKSYHKAN